MGRLDTYIGNWGGVRLLEGGRPGVPPLRRRSGTPRRRVREATSYKRGGGRVGTPAPTAESEQKQRAHNVRPYTTITNSSAYRKRDRSGTCPLKRRGETQFRRKFFWFLFFQEKELLTFFFKESRQLGKVLYEMQENFAEISTFLTGGTVAKAGRLW